ncbi:MAG TPA: molybdenum cofactor guanylyltransferase [Phycisphaerae bacterium]|nr:molybdenum cofactor guanylyltransferase [Phycisphaerae bacterium]
MNLAIGILTGGMSRRMGTPKALLPVDGSTLLERTIEIARSISDDLLLLGQPVFDLPTSAKSIQIVPDRHPGIGPIAGLESLLLARPDSTCILLACDMPNLHADLLKRLTEPADHADASVCATATDPPLHPCCALYKPACLPLVQEVIAGKRYGMISLLSRLRVHKVELSNDEAIGVVNWNEPNDLPDGVRPPRSPC